MLAAKADNSALVVVGQCMRACHSDFRCRNQFWSLRHSNSPAQFQRLLFRVMRAFCHASPSVWNNLPQSVISDLTVTTNTFKNRLKCALYSRAFLQWHVTLSHLRFFTCSEWHGVCLNRLIIIIKHAIKHKTSPARLAQVLQPSLAFCFSLQLMSLAAS